jgi:ferredoxin-NADP reductase
MRATEGVPSPVSQQGLKDTLRAQHYFLACVCKPQSDLAVSLPDEGAVQRSPVEILSREPLNRDIFRLVLRCDKPFAFRAGQFVQLLRADGLMRVYSLANLPRSEGVLEMHIRRLPNGAMSEWLFSEAQVGERLEVAGPSGSCFYLADDLDRPLLLAATGSGLAPLWGILNDALQQGHRGEITLYHGSYTAEGLYFVEELRSLAERYPQLRYVPCVDEGDSRHVTVGRADVVALEQRPQLKGYRVYVCGHPQLVSSLKRRAFLAGASLQDIYADPFLPCST